MSGVNRGHLVIDATGRSDHAHLVGTPDRIERNVVFAVYPGFQSLDLMGPFEVFAGVNQLLHAERRPAAPYRLTVTGPNSAQTPTESGLSVNVERSLARWRAPIDTLIVVGGFGAISLADEEPAFVRTIGRVAKLSRRTVSICTGAFVLAAAGLLDNKTVCTHWSRANLLSRTYPSVIVDPDSLYRNDGNVWTSAGVTAGIDLALALVADDHGEEIAQTVSRWLVMFYRRPGGQSQFAAPVWHGTSDRDALRAVQDAVVSDPGADHRLATMAERASMSERNFLRVFTREIGVTPTKFVESVRVNAACSALETTIEGVDAIARSVGFGTAETMRRTFLRTKGIAPNDYRQRFARHSA
jgi:transcriptional regulator GlxA family with amidase domain